jgi:hypothetical protein
MYWVQNGDVDQVRQLLDEGVNINVRDAVSTGFLFAYAFRMVGHLCIELFTTNMRM